MIPTEIRFTPAADELLPLVRRTLTDQKAREMTLPLAIGIAVTQVLNGALGLAAHRFGPLSFFSVFQVCFGVAVVPLTYWFRKLRATRATLLLKPNEELVLSVDDAGITLEKPRAVRIPWRDVSEVRDLGNAFLVSRTKGETLPILKRALADEGTALWADFAAHLESTRYLVRSTPAAPRIINARMQNRFL